MSVCLALLCTAVSVLTSSYNIRGCLVAATQILISCAVRSATHVPLLSLIVFIGGERESYWEGAEVMVSCRILAVWEHEVIILPDSLRKMTISREQDGREREGSAKIEKQEKRRLKKKKHLKIVDECSANFYARPDILHPEEGFKSKKFINRAWIFRWRVYFFSFLCIIQAEESIFVTVSLYDLHKCPFLGEMTLDLG